ncbi:MAG: c-type cytochrome [Verrucomicrobia bacterium]|nr:c-type cytochrome [Verrucomicrobiota bacterium]
MEVTLWAKSPMLYNPANMDIDKDGRIWVSEGVNYRGHYDRKPEGDRIMVLEDSDGDGQADKDWTFVQEPFLRCPMGVAVIDNKVVVSMTPDMIVYTDVNRDMVFDPDVDKREVLLTGFNGRVHDHSLHSVTVGPDGQWYWNAGNCGAVFTDRSGRTFRLGSSYMTKEVAGMASDDGHVYVGGFTARMNPDGSWVNVIGFNYRNSYEQTVTSFGDVFQNDNDDPPAARTTWVMEYGNAGFSSFDGKRSWGADRRPGQSTPIAEWRQEDPGTMPPGDVYGGGAPTGVAYYENGAFDKKYQGMLLSCEPARNTVFGYLPVIEGAGFKLERFNFLTTNTEEEFDGADFTGGFRDRTKDSKILFRPSDVAIGADGAVYVTDWYDARVGGHGDMDDTLSGAIYRVAPKGFKPKVPAFESSTSSGQVAGLKSPAVNVRAAAAKQLREQGEDVVNEVQTLLDSDNPYHRARAVWVLADLGDAGLKQVRRQLRNDDEQMRIVAYRALRRQGKGLIRLSKRMAADPSPAVRREVALAMRDIPFARAKDVLVAVAKGYDGSDRHYLEALGTGATGKESQLYDTLVSELGSQDSVNWSNAFANIAWRLHPSQSAAGFTQRALAEGLSEDDRKAALVALAYAGTKEAVNGIVEAASKSSGMVKAHAVWWLLNRKGSVWADYNLDAALKEHGIYDPATVQIVPMQIPEAPESKLPPIEDILKLKGDVAKGKLMATACFMCHKIGENGIDYGPDITAFARAQTSEVVLRSMIDPSAEISHGYNGSTITTKDNEVIHGRVLSNSDPVIVQSQGGVMQMIPKNKVESVRGLRRSLMLSAEQLGMDAQALADVLAYMKSL